MDIYIARQPIYGLNQEIEGYELLYRAGEQNTFNGQADGNAATKEVIVESVLDFGLDALTAGKRAFVNFTEDLLLSGTALMLDPEMYVVEVLEDVELSPAIIECLTDLKRKGYVLALDDYDGKAVPQEALALIDIIKLDFLLTTSLNRMRICNRMKGKGKILLAEKLETEADFQEALNIGCTLFQGYYFARPSIMKKSRRDIASGTYARLSRIAGQKELDMDLLEQTIRTDAYLTHKLMKRINSMQYYRGHSVGNIKQALVRLGDNEVRRWMMLVLTRNVVGGKSDEVVRLGLIRAVFCESMAKSAKHPEVRPEAFEAGIFSIFDADDPEYPELISELGLPDGCLAALRGEDTLTGGYLKLALSYERGEWLKIDELSRKLSVQGLPQMYVGAVNYADSLLSNEGMDMEE